MKNFLLFRKKNLILAEGTKGENSPAMAMSLNAELMQLGFCMTREALEALMSASEQHIGELYFDIIPALQKLMGANRTFKPFYKNFPQDVMNASDLKLWLNATMHYWSQGHWEPKDIDEASRGYAFERVVFTPVGLGKEEDVKKIFTTILAANGAITPEDKEIVTWFFHNYDDLEFPEKMPFKENLILAASLTRSAGYTGFEVKTATDVLRIAVHMSGGDISLPKVPRIQKNRGGWRSSYRIAAQQASRDSFKFKRFNRPDRKYLLGLLEKCGNIVEDMWRHRHRWVRLGEVLHPGEYKSSYPKAADAFNSIRNTKVTTFNSTVDAARKAGNLAKLLKLLETRPGEFGRRLDDLLRDNVGQEQKILGAFTNAASKIGNNVLLQLHGHLNNRATAGTIRQRTCIIKGQKAKRYVIEKEIPSIPADVLAKATASIENALLTKFQSMEPLGKVWIDPMLYKAPVPFAMRSSKKALRTMIRGSRVPFGDYKVLRAFVHWMDEHGTRDIDLSCAMFTPDMRSIGHVSFSSLRWNETIFHSGDVRQRRGACAEYIDVDIAKALKKGIRYILVSVHNFQNENLGEVPECVFGWMGRDFPENDQHFIPKTVQNSMQMAAESTAVYPVAIDLETREMIWLDIESEGIVMNSSAKGVNSMAALFNLADTRLPMGKLFELHAAARGELVATREEADFVFEEKLLYEYDEVLAKYL